MVMNDVVDHDFRVPRFEEKTPLLPLWFSPRYNPK